jgi:hypothetical protein
MHLGTYHAVVVTTVSVHSTATLLAAYRIFAGVTQANIVARIKLTLSITDSRSRRVALFRLLYLAIATVIGGLYKVHAKQTREG